MPLFTSSQFASASASGTDWRDTAKKVLEQLESAKTSEHSFNFGFLYISDHLVNDVTSILNLFRSVLNVENWVGTVGIGVCGSGEAFIDEPALAALVGYFNPDDFCLFPGAGDDSEQAEQTLAPWLEKTEPMLVFVHGDPLAEENPAHKLVDLEQLTNGFLIGGLSSSRTEHFQIAGDVFQGHICGAAFSQNIKLVTTLSQGCKPIGPVHTITKGDDHIIRELDSEKASGVFEDDLRSMAAHKIERDPALIDVKGDMIKIKEELPEDFTDLFKGEIHAAFPVSGSDQQDYLVRNIIGLDPDEGSMVISETVTTGEHIMFVHRDNKTVQQDLSKNLLDLRTRVKRETGEFKPKAALYISCVARAFADSEDEEPFDEMRLVRDIIGEIPMAGFYAGGEISAARLYGYTGILTLFL